MQSGCGGSNRHSGAETPREYRMLGRPGRQLTRYLPDSEGTLPTRLVLFHIL
jgi:hypothetical protein